MKPLKKRALDDRTWPAVVQFFRGYLHQDAGAEHVSIEEAFAAFWRDASAAEREAFAAEWRTLTARLSGRAWHRVSGPLETLGLSWMPGGGGGFSRLRKQVDAAIQHPHMPNPQASR